MFKWGKTSHKTTGSYEPKTPKINSISLPDERYSPITHQSAYTEKGSKRSSFLRRFTTPEIRGPTPLHDSWKTSHVPVASGRSRTRTVSTPVRDVEAPRPIRPHPSQGPFTEHADKIRIDPSRATLAPVGVPSAAYLEEQLLRARPELAKFLPPPKKYMSSEEYQDMMDERAKKLGGTFTQTPSKAWLQEQEEQARRHAPSAPPMKKGHSKPWVDEEDDDLKKLKPVPVVARGPDDLRLVTGSRPLKSALKKTSSIKPPLPKPLYEARQYGDPKAYYSENETDRRKSEWTRPTKVMRTPSKAFIEEQMEAETRTQQVQQQRARMPPLHHHAHSMPAPAPVHEFHPAMFQHTHSSSTGSPSENMFPQEHRRSRRGSNADGPRPNPSNYMDPYVKDSLLRSTLTPSWVDDGPVLTWPLVDFDKRRHLPHPAVFFDAGFNPRYATYEVRAKRGAQMTPLMPEERNMLVSLTAYFQQIVITSKGLEAWPVFIHPPNVNQRIRVIDVFRAIHDVYAVPLTKTELALQGPEYIQRCERAFTQRCRDAPESTHMLERQGMTRIDLLRGRRIFKGLVHRRGTPNHQFELLFE